jgi:hypothetical protein
LTTIEALGVALVDEELLGLAHEALAREQPAQLGEQGRAIGLRRGAHAVRGRLLTDHAW